MSYRLANGGDWVAVRAAVVALNVASPLYKYAKRPSLPKALDMVAEAMMKANAYIVDETYLLIAVEGEAWHSDDTCLEEVLVLKLSPVITSLRGITAALEDIAKAKGLDVIITHDSSINQRMGNLYKRAGYRSITTTYYKEVNHGSVD